MMGALLLVVVLVCFATVSGAGIERNGLSDVSKEVRIFSSF